MTVPVVPALSPPVAGSPQLSPLVPLGVVAAAMAGVDVAAIGLIVERFYL